MAMRRVSLMKVDRRLGLSLSPPFARELRHLDFRPTGSQACTNNYAAYCSRSSCTLLLTSAFSSELAPVRDFKKLDIERARPPRSHHEVRGAYRSATASRKTRGNVAAISRRTDRQLLASS